MSASNIPYDANEFTGKRILVTGGTRGIGEAIVIRLVTRRWHGAHYRQNRPHRRQSRTIYSSGRQHARGSGSYCQDSLAPPRRSRHSNQQRGRLFRAGWWCVGVDRRPLAARVRTESVFSSPSGSRFSSSDVKPRLWRHHPCFVHPAKATALRSYPGVCCRQSCSDQL